MHDLGVVEEIIFIFYFEHENKPSGYIKCVSVLSDFSLKNVFREVSSLFSYLVNC
jgi:hypothetical protein